MKALTRWVPVLLLTAQAVAAYGQHSYTPEEIAGGGQLYRANCLGCHGPSGDAIANAPLMSGKFRRGNSDEELIRIVRSGISGTPMTAQPSLSEMQAGTIVGFLRSVATAAPTPIANAVTLPPGDASRGKALFNGKGNCLSCHRVNETGSQFGPDLSAIGSPPAALGRGGGGGAGGARGAATVIPPAPSTPAGQDLALLQQSILDPNAVVPNATRYIQLTLRDGSTINGRLLNQDTYSIQVLDHRERLQSVPRGNLRGDMVFKSPMPSYRDKLTNQELADLIGYLATLKGPTTP